jgi:hypothetical protein
MDYQQGDAGKNYDIGPIHFNTPYQQREIKKWRAIAIMVDTNPDVLPFSISSTEHERRWAFFSQASGILHTPALRESVESQEAVVAIF